MDAQNAVESDPPKHAGVFSQQQQQQQQQQQHEEAKHQQHHPRKGSDSELERKTPSVLRASSPSRERERDKESRHSKTATATASNPLSSTSTATRASDDAPLPDRDSDAETIVLPGKDDHSPSKARKVRQEDRSESDGDAGKGNGQTSRPTNLGDNNAAGSRTSEVVKRKKLSTSVDRDRPRIKDGASSGLSSAPASPPHGHGHHHQQQPPPSSSPSSTSSFTTAQPLPPPPMPAQRQPSSSSTSSSQQPPPQQQQQQHSHHQHPHPHSHPHPHPDPHRRRSDAAATSLSDSEGAHAKPSAKSSLREKLKSGERLLSHKRKAPKAESDDEADQRKARRQRTTSVALDNNGRVYKDHKSLPSKPPQHESPTRSISPRERQHRRSISTQLASHAAGNLSVKKKRLQPPLHSTDYQSDESSASGSPHPRAAPKLRGIAIPSHDSHASPAKMPTHKKHLDAHGQTLLARACARGEYESVKMRLHDRPEDLNVADYAGNTPLQIAAINGCEDIVKLLIDAGCNMDCVNYDKDTPLLDAVDNGHAGVVKLLLDAGVNPRKANVNGEEPIDRVNEDTENGEEIRALLLAAKKRAGDRRRTSEDRHSHTDYHDARDRDLHPDSPRHSPAAAMSGTGRRSGTVRSTKTRNDLLYMPLDDKTLRQAAGRGDEETVARILQVKEGFDDPESMVAAARGGHDLVIQLLLGLGGANADPAPVPTLPAEFATPILAAIGQENIKVVELLLEQQGFDPTRRFKGETYYEIARRRQGTNWKEEEHMLKNAYDAYKRAHKEGTKNKSPGRREREREREKERDREREKEERRARRDEVREEARLQKRTALSPSRERDGEGKKKLTSSKLGSPKDQKRSDSFTSHGDDGAQKRGLHRPAKDDRQASHVSDREISPVLSHKGPKPKRTESDMAGISSEGEAVKPRRKLVSKGELKGERERQKRGSMTSASSNMKEPSSPSEAKNDEVPEKSKPSEKYHDRTKALRRDDSRDRLSVSGDGVTKRHRTSTTPERPSDCDRDNSDVPAKKRRIEGDNSEKRSQRSSVSAEDKSRRPTISRDSGVSKPLPGPPRKNREDDARPGQDERDAHRKDSSRSGSGEKSIRVKAEDQDTEMTDEQPLRSTSESRERRLREEEEQARKKEHSDREEAKREEERRRAKLEEKRKREQEEARLREEEERKHKEEEERERQRKREEEEAARKLREQAERERREAEETARKEEEEKRRLEEERKRIEEEQRKEEELRRREEEQKKREEEEERERARERERERLRREQLERQAAEEARRQRERQEEEERQERERRERAFREEVERKRAAQEAEQRRLREEQEERERARVEKLPPLLRWLSTASNAKTAAMAEKFKYIPGIRYDTICAEAIKTPMGRERWTLNTHVALLLGEKDLELLKYPAWERVPVSHIAKDILWRTEWLRYALIHETVRDLGLQLPGHYYGDQGPTRIDFDTKRALKKAAWEKFDKTDMFFVKVSDFMSIVPKIAHLQGMKLAVDYRELPEDPMKAWISPQRWRTDPDASRYHGFAPRHKYYVNGELVGEELPSVAQTSKTPFPEVRVPRRGLVRVYPDDPEYNQICMEQGLSHLIKQKQTSSPQLPNGVHSSPPTQPTAPPTGSTRTINGTNGHSDEVPGSDETEAPSTHDDPSTGMGTPSG